MTWAGEYGSGKYRLTFLFFFFPWPLTGTLPAFGATELEEAAAAPDLLDSAPVLCGSTKRALTGASLTGIMGSVRDFLWGGELVPEDILAIRTALWTVGVGDNGRVGRRRRFKTPLISCQQSVQA